MSEKLDLVVTLFNKQLSGQLIQLKILEIVFGVIFCVNLYLFYKLFSLERKMKKFNFLNDNNKVAYTRYRDLLRQIEKAQEIVRAKL